MRFLWVLLCLFVAVTARGAEWRNDEFGCSANLPDSQGWAPIETGNAPGLTVLVAMQQPVKQAVFGINVLHDLPTANLRDPATIAAVEQKLRSFGYQFIGRSTVTVGGREWVQFPVRAVNEGQPMTGVIRYTAANNQVYAVSMLLGGGKEAAQDPELQAAAASVRITEVQATAAAPVPTVEPTPQPTAPAPEPAAPATSVPAEESPAPTVDEANAPVKIGPVTLTRHQFRLLIYGLAGLVVLMILLKIIGSGNAPKKP